jgi:CMP/dCMP kinase
MCPVELKYLFLVYYFLMLEINPIPIIAIDGTSSSGKGTIAYRLARHLGYNYLNSGALYRLTAYVALQNNINLSHKEALIEVAKGIHPVFEGKQVIVHGVDVWPIISTQEYGNHASAISPIKELRDALFEAQRAMIQSPGLVAEGRDMCTHVFTDAHVKLYLDGAIEVRAERRYKDEASKGSTKTLEDILSELSTRDHRDMTRDEGRLYPAENAVLIDTTSLTIQEVLATCIDACKDKNIQV